MKVSELFEDHINKGLPAGQSKVLSKVLDTIWNKDKATLLDCKNVNQIVQKIKRWDSVIKNQYKTMMNDTEWKMLAADLLERVQAAEEAVTEAIDGTKLPSKFFTIAYDSYKRYQDLNDGESEATPEEKTKIKKEFRYVFTELNGDAIPVPKKIYEIIGDDVNVSLFLRKLFGRDHAVTQFLKQEGGVVDPIVLLRKFKTEFSRVKTVGGMYIAKSNAFPVLFGTVEGDKTAIFYSIDLK